MTDWLSVVLGTVLLRLIQVGAVVVVMALVLRGEYVLAAGLAVPLVLIALLMVTETDLLA